MVRVSERKGLKNPTKSDGDNYFSMHTDQKHNTHQQQQLSHYYQDSVLTHIYC